MLRTVRLALGGLTLLVLSGGEARSQYYYPGGYGYNGYGFGGWGSTPQGNIARGMGVYAAGEGVYNYDTAKAESIDTDTVIRFNQYVHNSELESRKRYNAIHARKLKMDDSSYQARAARIRDNPSKEDIDSGDALNVLLNQMTDPQVLHGSSLRLANTSVAAEAIKEIPFRDETDAITLSLDEMTDPTSWPLALRSDELKKEREAYQKAVDEALEEDTEGTLKPETVAKVREAVAALSKKVNETIPVSRQPDHLQATNYVKGLAGMSRMLEKPNVEAILAELEKVKTTTVGNLVAFMHSYNLRFAPATTAKQRAVYRDLMPLMVESRDKIVGKPADNAAAAKTPPKPVDNPTALFHGFDATHLNPAPPTPKP